MLIQSQIQIHQFYQDSIHRLEQSQGAFWGRIQRDERRIQRLENEVRKQNIILKAFIEKRYP